MERRRETIKKWEIWYPSKIKASANCVIAIFHIMCIHLKLFELQVEENMHGLVNCDLSDLISNKRAIYLMRKHNLWIGNENMMYQNENILFYQFPLNYFSNAKRHQ